MKATGINPSLLYSDHEHASSEIQFSKEPLTTSKEGDEARALHAQTRRCGMAFGDSITGTVQEFRFLQSEVGVVDVVGNVGSIRDSLSMDVYRFVEWDIIE